MTVRTITVTIPEMLYLQLEAAARSSAQSLETVVAQSLERTIPAHLAALLPVALQTELEAMEHLSDEALRAIAYSTAPPERIKQMDELIALKQDGAISRQQQAHLNEIRAESEALMVRKAHAFVLLKSRGHTPPRSTSCRCQLYEPPLHFGSAYGTDCRRCRSSLWILSD